ncbi:MAG TPA: hypothetical protein VI603_00250 [Saprospiraceae bacterium]|nr:hypothetical protein [Saprospiraceae bacterium]
MKTKYLLLSMSMTLTAVTGYAGNSVNTEDNEGGIVQMEDLMADKAMVKADRQLLKAEKQQYRAEKRMTWFSTVINKKMARSQNKALGGLNDPVDKWFWFAIILWGAAILFSFSIGGWYFYSLLGLAGTICFILWLVKKFA